MRPGTFSTSKLLQAMGIKGGLLPQLGSGPIQPVAVVSDFTSTQSPEAVEARAFVAFDNGGMGATSHMHGFYFFSLAHGG